MVDGRSQKDLAEAQLNEMLAKKDETTVQSLMEKLTVDSRFVYDNWFHEVGGTSNTSRRNADGGSDDWGRCCSVMTFNVNKIPWTYLPSYLDLIYEEASWSILSLQEVYNDSGMNDEINGWWNMSGHSVLVCRCFNGTLICLALHKAYAPTGFIPWHVSTTTAVATCQIAGISVKVVATYFPNSGYDSAQPELFHAALENLDAEVVSLPLLILGDLNAWLGCCSMTGDVVGQYNLSQTNPRGLQ
eukprot:5300174-Amphidinium_carterae.1